MAVYLARSIHRTLSFTETPANLFIHEPLASTPERQKVRECPTCNMQRIGSLLHCTGLIYPNLVQLI